MNNVDIENIYIEKMVLKRNKHSKFSLYKIHYATRTYLKKKRKSNIFEPQVAAPKMPLESTIKYLYFVLWKNARGY